MTPLPEDMRDLLIRLDQKVADGFHAVNAKLDRMEARADGHETRLRTLELDLADRSALKDRFFDAEEGIADHTRRLDKIETTASNAKTMIGGLWAVTGSAILALIAKLFGIY